MSEFFRDADTHNFYLISPFFNNHELIMRISDDCNINFIVTLSRATKSEDLRKIINKPKLKIRYFNKEGLHSKIYITDKSCLIGSANMTKPGMGRNFEMGLSIDKSENQSAYQQIKDTFDKYWEMAEPLTPEKLNKYATIENITSAPQDGFKKALEECKELSSNSPNPSLIENSKEKRKASSQTFQKNYQDFVSAMKIVEDIYKQFGTRIMDNTIALKYEINRFLSYLTERNPKFYKSSDSSTYYTKLLDNDDLKKNIREYIRTWFNDSYYHGTKASAGMYSGKYTFEEYPLKLKEVKEKFKTEESIDALSLPELFNVLYNIHSFHGQFVQKRIKTEDRKTFFTNINYENENKLKNTLKYLLFNTEDDIVTRIENCLHNEKYKISLMGDSSIAEVLAWVSDIDDIYPYNLRALKSLRFLGFDIKNI